MSKIFVYKLMFNIPKIFSYIFTFFALIITSELFAGIIKGTVTDENGRVLPGATVYVPELTFGTVSNAEGFYEVEVEPGLYTVIIRFLGYETFSQKVNINNEVVTLNTQLIPRPIMLENVTIYSGKEDPAYSIMRKAIAKAAFHRQIVDSYYMQVYMKGKGKLNSIPFLLRKKLKEEGVDTTRLFISESVSQISYRRPGHYTEKVISVRSTGDDNNSSPISYITASFYDAEIAETISPLAPRALSQYKFEFLESYVDQDYVINKIKVIPKYKSDNLFEGHISIVEDHWSIHSLELQASKLGIIVDITQMYQPFQDLAWMPISHKFKVNGKILGISFSYDYQAAINYKEVAINKVLNTRLVVVDEKKDKEKAGQLKELESNIRKLEKEVGEDREITTRELKKQVKKYEKTELKTSDDPDLILSRTYSIDSLAYGRDRQYWDSVRTVPLTAVELKGYRQIDSMAGTVEKDSIKKNRPTRFKVKDPFVGRYYRWSPSHGMRLSGLFDVLGFNTVEGIYGEYAVSYYYRKQNKPGQPRKRIRLSPQIGVRYSAARNKWMPNLRTEFSHSANSRRTEVNMSIGQFIYQLNRQEPIIPFLNMAYTLLMEENYLKLFQADGFQLDFSRRFSGEFTLSGGLRYENRIPLINSSDLKLLDWDNKEYSANIPDHFSYPDVSWPNYQSADIWIAIETRPWVKYQMRNGNKYAIRSSSPLVSFSILKGISGWAGSDTDYLKTSTNFQHTIPVGPASEMIFQAFYEQLFGNVLYFPDYIHFVGNQTIYSPGNDFRGLDYYRFSSDKYALGFNSELKISRNMFISALPFFAEKGLKDYFVLNFLHNSVVDQYWEIGYGLDYAFKFMKIEIIGSFLNQSFYTAGVRIGMAPDINFN